MQKEVPGCGKKIHDVERGTVGGGMARGRHGAAMVPGCGKDAVAY